MSYTNQLIKLSKKINIKLATINLDDNKINVFASLLANYRIFASKDDILAFIENNNLLKDLMERGTVYKDYFGSGIDNPCVIIYSGDIRGGKRYIWVLSKNRDLFPEAVQHHLVVKTDKIPDMYLALTVEDDLYLTSTPYKAPSPEETSFQKKNAQNLWLIDLLKKFFFSIRDDNKALMELLSHNEDEIEKINNYKTIIQPKFLGQGADGPAYLLAKGLVIKFTLSRYAYLKAKESMDLLEINPELAKTEAKVYEVGELNVYGHGTIYYIILEEETPMTFYKSQPFGSEGSEAYRTLRKVFSTIIDRIYLNRDDFRKLKLLYTKIVFDKSKNESDLETFKKEINSIIDNTIQVIATDYSDYQLETIKNGLSLNDNWLTNFIEEIIMKYCSSRTDLHFGNLGVTTYGQLRYYDPAHEDWMSAINY